MSDLKDDCFHTCFVQPSWTCFGEPPAFVAKLKLFAPWFWSEIEQKLIKLDTSWIYDFKSSTISSWNKREKAALEDVTWSIYSSRRIVYFFKNRQIFRKFKNTNDQSCINKKFELKLATIWKNSCKWTIWS